MKVSIFNTKLNLILLSLAILLVIVICVVATILIRHTKVILTDDSGKNFKYHQSEIFENYLDEWGILRKDIIYNPFDKKEYLVNKIKISISDIEPTNPSYVVLYQNTPPITLHSVEDVIVDKSWNLSIYMGPEIKNITNYYENDLLWLIIYTLFKRSHPNFPEDQIPLEIKPYVDSLKGDNNMPIILINEK